MPAIRQAGLSAKHLLCTTGAGSWSGLTSLFEPADSGSSPQSQESDLDKLQRENSMLRRQCDLYLMLLHQAQQDCEKFFHLSREQSQLLSREESLLNRSQNLLANLITTMAVIE